MGNYKKALNMCIMIAQADLLELKKRNKSDDEINVNVKRYVDEARVHLIKTQLALHLQVTFCLYLNTIEVTSLVALTHHSKLRPGTVQVETLYLRSRNLEKLEILSEMLLQHGGHPEFLRARKGKPAPSQQLLSKQKGKFRR